MGFFERILKKKKAVAEGEKYVDLTEWSETGKKEEVSAKMHIRVAEIYRYEDLSDLTTPVFDGDLLLLDFSPIAGDDFTFRRVTSELKRLAQDINGDLAGIGRNMLVLAPAGVKIEREKIRPSFK
ncbi:MAG: cell division protein SepF [Candidatus Thermoplasmatota archaeon]|nr:cell division protein SepF [Candidatus Thermoplasmatota archaeon]